MVDSIVSAEAAAERRLLPSRVPEKSREKQKTLLHSLLLGNTESLSSSSSGLSFLTSNLESPEMTETSVVANLLHALQILSESGIDHVGVELRVGSVFNAPLSVQEPFWNSVV